MSAPSVIFLARALDIGGAQTQLVELASALHRAGWKVTVATFYAGGALESPLVQAGVPVVCLHKRGRWDMLSFMWRLARFIRARRPDVVHGSMDMCNILLSVLRAFIRPARIVWSVAASNMDLSYYNWLQRVEFRLGVLLSRTADLIISNSEAGRAYHVAQGYFPGRMTVIANGIDVGRFKPDAEGRRDLRAEWGIGLDERLVGLVGRLDPMKDHPNFLRAAAQVAAERPDVRFVCVGDGPPAWRERIHALATELALDRRLVWAGERKDIARVYNALDLAVSASMSEGLPNTIIEAIATGVPCVVTDVGDCAAVVGDLGWVCPHGDSEALSRAMTRALDSLPCDTAAIRTRAIDHYSVAELARRSAAQFAALVENQGVGPERSAPRG